MKSAGYVQAYMDREERSMSMSVTAGPGVPASMSIGRSMSVTGDGRHGKKRRRWRRKGQNIVINCAADIDCTSKSDLAVVISHISQVHDVVIRCHRDVSIRRVELKAKWQDSWAPIVLSPE